MDAIKYIRDEHSKIRKKFALLSKISNIKIKKTRFKSLSKDLVRHETMEQKAWYPVLRKHVKLKSIISHLITEEKSAAKAIKKLNKKMLEIMWKLRLMKFKHDVLHHAKEEEKKLFPKVRKLYTKKELSVLGTKLRKFKAKLK